MQHEEYFDLRCVSHATGVRAIIRLYRGRRWDLLASFGITREMQPYFDRALLVLPGERFDMALFVTRLPDEIAALVASAAHTMTFQYRLKYAKEIERAVLSHPSTTGRGAQKARRRY